MINSGMKASELIKQLEFMIIQHGDREVFTGGTDYPTGVRGVSVEHGEDNPYVPEGSFKINQKSC